GAIRVGCTARWCRARSWRSELGTRWLMSRCYGGPGGGHYSVCEGVLHDVQTHAQRRITLLGGIVMDFFVLEAVPEVAIVGKEYRQPPVVDNPECLGGAPVMFMNLRQSLGEFVKPVKNRMGEGQLDQLVLGEHLLHFPPERGGDAEVVVHPQEPARDQVAAHVGDLGGGELHVPVPA